MDTQDTFGRFTIKALWPADMRLFLQVYLYLEGQESFSVVTMTTKIASDLFSECTYLLFGVKYEK
jgi:hypothetical protein